MKSNVRNAYFDAWKGVAIISVVAIHASNDAALFPVGSFNWLFGLMFRQVVDFSVPLFLALAGYFSVGSFGMGAIDYYKGRVLRVLVPYVVWTAICLLLKSRHEHLSVADILCGLGLGTGIGAGYFVIVILQFTALTPFLHAVRSEALHVAIMVLGLLVGLAYKYYFVVFDSSNPLSAFPASALPLFVWYPFYHLGYFAGRFCPRLEGTGVGLGAAAFLLVIGFVVACLEGAFWAYRGNYTFGASQLKASSFFLSVVVFAFVLLFLRRGGFIARREYLGWLGRNSYIIYLSHLLFLGAFQKWLKSISWVYGFQPLFVGVSVLAVIFACSVMTILTRRALSDRISREVFG